MENSIFLSHLPLRFSHHRTLDFLKKIESAPTPGEVATALCTQASEPRKVWEMIETVRQQAQITLDRLKSRRIFAVDFWSIHYPSILRHLEEPPWVLYFIGNLPAPLPTLAVVGTRRPNAYGTEVVASIVLNLTLRPLQLVSGLAYGIDSLAHFHACEAKIPNFAVLGCGLDEIYPTANTQLAERIVDGGGGVLSEFPPGTLPFPQNFPRRNRIIAGLAHVVWIVQGTGKSGSLHTAIHALNQSKTVVTTPGDVFSELSEVPHRLLADGAQPILRASDLDLLLASYTAKNAVIDS